MQRSTFEKQDISQIKQMLKSENSNLTTKDIFQIENLENAPKIINEIMVRLEHSGYKKETTREFPFPYPNTFGVERGEWSGDVFSKFTKGAKTIIVKLKEEHKWNGAPIDHEVDYHYVDLKPLAIFAIGRDAKEEVEALCQLIDNGLTEFMLFKEEVRGRDVNS